MISYDEIINLPITSKLTIKEYNLDRHEVKRLVGEATGTLIQIIRPNEGIDKDTIKIYYPNLPEAYYPVVSRSQFTRIVLETGKNSYQVPIYQTFELNPYYLEQQLQVIETLLQSIESHPEIPSDILGFNAYNIGSKFKS